MKDAVVIKGNKAGMTVYLEKDLDFDEVLQAIAKKFKATAKFWGAAQMTLTLEGRDLTPEEEYRVVQTITDNSDIEVLCLLDTDGNRTKKCEKALNERLMELSSLTGQFYKGNLRDGDELESEASIVVIGDFYNPYGFGSFFQRERKYRRLRGAPRSGLRRCLRE